MMTTRLLLCLLIATATTTTTHASDASDSSSTEPLIPFLDFDYEFNSTLGPLSWRHVNTDDNEWNKFRHQEDINLDVPGNECKSTRRPSPIWLTQSPNDRCRANHEILTREIRFDDCQLPDVTFYRTPQTLRADFPLLDTTCRRPTIDLPNGYPYRWFMHHFEVHLRAEHVLDGRRFDGEIQQYHLGQQDQKREMAAVSILLDASGYQDDARLQIYIDRWQEALDEEIAECNNRNNTATRRRTRFLRAAGRNDEQDGEQNTAYHESDSTRTNAETDVYFNNSTSGGLARTALEDEEHVHSIRSLEEFDEDGWPLSSYAPRRKMFPYDIWPTIYHYRYRGMITSPPCAEIVSWRVMDEPLIISRRQYKALARLLNTETCLIERKTSFTGENFRPLQEVNHNHQDVVHCTSEDFGYNLYPPDKQ